VQLDPGLREVAAEAGDLPVLGLAEVQRLVAREHEWELVGQLGLRSSARYRFGEGGERRLADVEEVLDVELDPPGARPSARHHEPLVSAGR
jgi:hypothetical protein